MAYFWESVKSLISLILYNIFYIYKQKIDKSYYNINNVKLIN